MITIVSQCEAETRDSNTREAQTEMEERVEWTIRVCLVSEAALLQGYSAVF